MKSYVRNNKLIVSDMPGSEKVMLSIEKGEYYGMNRVASVIWEMLEQPLTTDELVARLRERFQVDEDTCRREVEGFLAKMLEEQLIVYA